MLFSQLTFIHLTQETAPMCERYTAIYKFGPHKFDELDASLLNTA